MLNQQNTIPIDETIALTIRESAEYSNIGINRIEKLLRSPNCPFVLFVGSKKLVKRKEFEDYISSHLFVWISQDLKRSSTNVKAIFS